MKSKTVFRDVESEVFELVERAYWHRFFGEGTISMELYIEAFSLAVGSRDIELAAYLLILIAEHDERYFNGTLAGEFLYIAEEMLLYLSFTGAGPETTVRDDVMADEVADKRRRYN